MTNASRPPDPQYHTRPVWVKTFIVIGILVLVFVVLSLTGVLPGGHGPGRHLPAGDSAPVQSLGGAAETSQSLRI